MENKETKDVQSIHTDLILQLQMDLTKAKTYDDVCAVYFTMLEQNFTGEEIEEVVNNAKMPSHIVDEIAELEISTKR